MNDSQPIRPHLVSRVWGGERLRALLRDAATSDATAGPIGEAWFGTARGDATHALVKLLDVAGALSVQVHPDDAQALRLAGPTGVGKHEAWVVLEAAPGASVLLGMADGATLDDLLCGEPGRVEAALAVRPGAVGDVIDVSPGTVHAPGAGLLLYEIQQRSDLTYRIWDWGRPRALHLEASRHCLRPDAHGIVGRLPDGSAGPTRLSEAGAPFRLEHLRVDGSAEGIGLALERAVVLSVIEGSLQLHGLAAASVAHPCTAGHGLVLGGGQVALQCGLGAHKAFVVGLLALRVLFP